MTDDTNLFGKPYFGDSRLDRMMGIIFSLAGEVAVLKSQVARPSGQSDEDVIDSEMQAFARQVVSDGLGLSAGPSGCGGRRPGRDKAHAAGCHGR
jgi:hypothetical protein